MMTDPTSQTSDGSAPRGDQSASRDTTSQQDQVPAGAGAVAAKSEAFRPDATKPETATPEPPATKGAAPLELQVSNVVALQGAEIFHWGLYKFPECMESFCNAQACACISKKQRETFTRSIRDPLSILVFLLAWKESPFVTDEEVSEAGLQRSFAGKPLTRNAIGKAMRVQVGAKASEETKYARRAGRWTDAAIAFGLIELDDRFPDDFRENCKPIRATRKLAALMVQAGTAFAQKIHDEMR